MILRTFVKRTQSKIFDINRENAIGRRRPCILRILMSCKFFLCPQHDDTRRSGGRAPIILHLSSRWRCYFLSPDTLLVWGRDSVIHWLGGYAGPDPVWTAWKGENIWPLPDIETRYLDSLAAHDLSLQFLLTGVYNHVCIEVVSMI